MEQLILHLVGDYVTQSDWMAQNKTKRFWPAFLHALVYSLPFLLLGSSWAFWVIMWTHFFIDRYRLARFVVWVKNVILHPDFWNIVSVKWDIHGEEWSWKNCDQTGYKNSAPPWLAVWLLIAADNTLHLAINYCALRWL